MQTNEKILPSKVISETINSYKSKKKIIGLCHGVFDLVHYGHYTHFKECKEKCDILIISVTSDKYVNKGPGRPKFNLYQRMHYLSSIEFIDFVIESNSKSSEEILNLIKPNYYFKGPDYKDLKEDKTGKIYNELKILQKYGGKYYVTKDDKYSSSNLINVLYDQTYNYYINSIKKKYEFSQINKIINQFEKTKVLIIGEIIVDHYIYCKALGKSGKEPVLTLEEVSEKKFLGGIGGISNNLSELSKNITILSTINNQDSNYKFIKSRINKKIKQKLIIDNDNTNISKKRFVEEITAQKLLGVYKLNKHEMKKKTKRKILDYLKKNIKNFDVVLCVDYSHGLLDEEIANVVVNNSKFIAINSQLNSSNIGYHTLNKFKKADLLLVNEDELRNETRQKNLNINELLENFVNKNKFDSVLLTRGKNGVLLKNKKSKIIYDFPALTNFVVDKVGTGDSMLPIATLSKFYDVKDELTLLLSSIVAFNAVHTLGTEKKISKINILRNIEYFLK